MSVALAAGLVIHGAPAHADPPDVIVGTLPGGAPHPTTPDGFPQVLVQVPSDLTAGAPLHLVVFFHGHLSCITHYLATGPAVCVRGGRPTRGLGVAAAHAAGRAGTILVAPQLAWLARSSDPGRFATRGYFTQFVREVVTSVIAPRLGRTVGLESVGSITIVAHSGGYLAALRVIQNGELADRVRTVVMLDAMYAGAPELARWAAGASNRRVVSIHTSQRQTSALSADLARRLTRSLGAAQVAVNPGDIGPAISTHRVVVARARSNHNDVPATHLAEILAALRQAAPRPPN